jgi:putative phosphoribosyl transferase
MFLYRDREDAGEKLASLLKEKTLENPLLLGLPRGGVPIAAIIAERLGMPFDVLVVRKIGHPGQREYGIGAMTEDEVAYIADPQLNALRQDIQQIITQEREELRRRVKLYRKGRSLPWVENRDIVLIDDGLATGVTATAAAKYLKEKGAGRVLLAIPVAPPVENRRLQQYVDDVICPYRPANFSAVGLWYEDFSEVTDEEVKELLQGKSASSKDLF